MVAYYVIKDANGVDTGTATGDGGRYTTQPTGSFATLGAANYYPSTEAALAATTSPVGGDIFLWSDIHDHSYSAQVTFAGPTTGPPLGVLSVSDSNMDQAPSTRGKESITGGVNDYTISGGWSCSFIFIVCSDDFTINLGASWFMRDSLFCMAGTGSQVRLVSDSGYFRLLDSEIQLNTTGATIVISNGSTFETFGGSVTTTTGGVTQLFNGTSGNGGCTINIRGTDISAITGTIINGMGGSRSSDDTMNIFFDLCNLATGVTLVGETLESFNQKVLFTRCTDTSAEAEYSRHQAEYAGTVDHDDVIFREDDDEFPDSATKISYKMSGSANNNVASALVFDYPTAGYSELSNVSTDTLRFYFASTATLTDSDLYIEVYYPDATNKDIANTISTAGFPLGPGTTLTTDSGSDWRDGAGALTGYNEYLVDIDTSTLAGADSVPRVRIVLALPSTDVHVAAVFDPVA